MLAVPADVRRDQHAGSPRRGEGAAGSEPGVEPERRRGGRRSSASATAASSSSPSRAVSTRIAPGRISASRRSSIIPEVSSVSATCRSTSSAARAPPRARRGSRRLRGRLRAARDGEYVEAERDAGPSRRRFRRTRGRRRRPSRRAERGAATWSQPASSRPRRAIRRPRAKASAERVRGKLRSSSRARRDGDAGRLRRRAVDRVEAGAEARDHAAGRRSADQLGVDPRPDVGHDIGGGEHAGVAAPADDARAVARRGLALDVESPEQGVEHDDEHRAVQNGAPATVRELLGAPRLRRRAVSQARPPAAARPTAAAARSAASLPANDATALASSLARRSACTRLVATRRSMNSANSGPRLFVDASRGRSRPGRARPQGR